MQAPKYLAPDQEAIVTATIHPYRYGQVRYQGSWWLAHCHQPLTLLPDTLVRVIHPEGIRLLVEPIEVLPGGIEPFFSSTPSSPCGENEGDQQPSSRLPLKRLFGTILGVLLLSVPPALALNRVTGIQFGDRSSVAPIMQLPSVQAQRMINAVGDRCQVAGTNPRFCHFWLQEAHRYSDYWDIPDGQVFDTLLLDGLSRLSLRARTKLGRFDDRAIRRQLQIMRALNVNEEAVNQRTDQRFFTLFPQRINHIAHSEHLTRQIWFACRQEVLTQLKYEFSQGIW